MKLKSKRPKLVKVFDKGKLVYDGYYYDELVAWFPEELRDKFVKFMYGQTVGLENGRGVVYRWDFNRFLEGDMNTGVGWD